MNKRLTLFMTGLSGGGAERVMITLAEEFGNRGYYVDLVVANARGELAAEVPKPVRLVDLKAQRIMTSLPAFTRYIKHEKPIGILSAMSPTNILAVWARQISRVPTRLVLSEHSHLSMAVNNAGTCRSRLLPVLMRRAYTKADDIVAVSNGVADDLATTLGLSTDSIHVIYNPVVTQRMLDMSREPVNHEWFSDGQPPVIVSVGRLTAAKDYSTLLRAFAELRGRHATRLIILGEGEERSALEQLARQLNVEQDISLPGFVVNPYAYMRAARVFVLSSRWEGFGNVLVEAIACRTPVVATNCPGGPGEILEITNYGLIANVGDPSELSAMIERAMYESALWTEFECSRLNLFNHKKVADQYLEKILK